MLDFLSRNKIFFSVVFITIVLVIGGVYLFSKNGPTIATSGSTVSSNILISSDSQKTGGFANGVYQPASQSAKITLVEFGDFECPACGAYSPFVKQLLTDFSGKINFVFRNYPLPQHANAPISSYAAEAAGLQGKYWEMHDKLYENQSAWAVSTDPKTIFTGYAKDIGLDVTKFSTDIDSQTVKDKVTKDLNDGNLVNLTETPTFYLNGQKISPLPSNYNDFKSLIESAVKTAN